MTNKPLAIISGSGPGLGLYLLNYLDRQGYKVIGFNRSNNTDDPRIKTCDLSNGVHVNEEINNVIELYGPPKLVVHNTAQLMIKPFSQTSVEDFEVIWRAMVLSGVNLAKAVLPSMAVEQSGSFIVSGATASLRGSANFSAFSAAKSALRSLTQSLAKEYGANGIHIAHVILDGILNTQASKELHNLDDSKMLQLNDVADAYIQLASQPKSAWTFEMDLRPMGESF